MTVFEKARELSSLILESKEYKDFEKARIDFENMEISKSEFLKTQKIYNAFVEQIISLIKLNVYDEEQLEENLCKRNSNCDKCKGCSRED